MGKRLEMIFKLLRPTRSSGQGYSEVHCISPRVDSVENTVIACSNSSQELIPEDINVGLPVDAISSSKGVFVTSPEGILYMQTSICSNNSTAAQEKGEERKAMPISSHNAFKSFHCEIVKDVRWK